MTLRRRILLADDDPDCRDIYGEFLTVVGYSVVTAADGEEAVTYGTRYPFDLILIDLALPKIDGYRVMKELRAHPGTKDIPIITISAGDEEMHTAAKAAGANLTLRKPCLPQQVEAEIRALIDGRGDARAVNPYSH
jgi:DNA-binding response OmpR family regulator